LFNIFIDYELALDCKMFWFKAFSSVYFQVRIYSGDIVANSKSW